MPVSRRLLMAVYARPDTAAGGEPVSCLQPSLWPMRAAVWLCVSAWCLTAMPVAAHGLLDWSRDSGGSAADGNVLTAEN